MAIENETFAKRASRARQRALRAAQVVTLGLALNGCYQQHDRAAMRTEPAEPMRTVPLVDAGPMLADAAAEVDAAVADARAPDTSVADASADATIGCWQADRDFSECCESVNWDPNLGCGVWGPYVPPGEKLPSSRSLA